MANYSRTMDKKPPADMIGSMRVMLDQFAEGNIYGISICTVTVKDGELVPGKLNYARGPDIIPTLNLALDLVKDDLLDHFVEQLGEERPMTGPRDG